jgi:hypothetical protein
MKSWIFSRRPSWFSCNILVLHGGLFDFFSPKKLIAPSEAFSIIGFEKPGLHTDPDSRKVRVRILKGNIRIRNQVATNRKAILL